ncbi:hypothetical protein AA313_de0209696 [Arthrobotrys entomopaga]|nr:hypothetical protein AA313_de0209696 [Arthrobotrys entomopaga]
MLPNLTTSVLPRVSSEMPGRNSPRAEITALELCLTRYNHCSIQPIDSYSQVWLGFMSFGVIWFFLIKSRSILRGKKIGILSIFWVSVQFTGVSLESGVFFH